MPIVLRHQYWICFVAFNLLIRLIIFVVIVVICPFVSIDSLICKEELACFQLFLSHIPYHRIIERTVQLNDFIKANIHIRSSHVIAETMNSTLAVLVVPMLWLSPIPHTMNQDRRLQSRDECTPFRHHLLFCLVQSIHHSHD